MRVTLRAGGCMPSLGCGCGLPCECALRPFQDVIQQAVPEIKSAAVFIGPKGLGKWQTLELRSFISQCVDTNIPVIPVLLPGVQDISGFFLFLKGLNSVRFSRLDDSDD